MKSAPRSIQRTPAILGCTARETRNVERANQRAIAWVQNALARLSVPAAVAPYLYEHFRVMPSDTAAVESIRVEFRHVLEELQGETITYSCATTDDPSCQNPEGGQYAGYASSVGSLDAYFCDNLAQSGCEELTSTLLHESIHAMVPGMDDGPYFGESDYPGERPLANTDAYTQFAAVLAGGVHGLPRPSASAAEAAQEFDFLGSAASVGVDPSSGEGSARVFYSFAPDSEDVTEDARFYLDGMLDDMHDILDRYGGRGHFVLYAAGHSDGQTTAERSPALSRSRADNVVRYLLDRNEEDPLARRVEFSSVVVRGYADRRRAYAGSSAAARHFNRRVHVEALYVGSPGS
jgi:outer membrane protein OmpA-like peptidoglycan-associated protein